MFHTWQSVYSHRQAHDHHGEDIVSIGRSSTDAAPLVRVKAKFTIKTTVCCHRGLLTSVVDSDFRFDSHEWSCTHNVVVHAPIIRKANTTARQKGGLQPRTITFPLC